MDLWLKQYLSDRSEPLNQKFVGEVADLFKFTDDDELIIYFEGGKKLVISAGCEGGSGSYLSVESEIEE